MAAVEAATKQFGSFAARSHVNVLLVTGCPKLAEVGLGQKKERAG